MAAPVLDSSALPHTPAHEWANETNNALTSKDNLVPESKPVSEGAFPKTSEHETAPDAFPSTEQIKNAGVNVIDTAKAYLPAQEDVGKMIEKAKEYLPQAVQGYFPATTETTETRSTSLPSQEADGDTLGKSDGVGALPGKIDEPAVAKLPDERSSQEKKPFEHATSLPSQEVHGDATGKSAGVGALPGTINEAAVAKLPDERSSEEKKPFEDEHPIMTTTNTLKESESQRVDKGTRLSTHPVTAKDDKIVDNQPHQEGGSPVHTLPPAPIREYSSVADQGHSQQKAIAPHLAGAQPDQPTSVTNPTETLAPPANEVHSQLTTDQPPKEFTGQHTTTTSALEGSNDRPTTSAPLENQDSPTATKSTLSTETTETEKKRKAGLMDKIKGEVKVLSGKMSHNEKKIEEGKKLMGKV